MNVEGKTHARSKIVLVTRHRGSLRNRRINQARDRLGKLLILPAQAKVEGQPLAHADIVLSKKRPLIGRNLESSATEGLLIITRVAFAGQPRRSRANHCRSRASRGEQRSLRVQIINDKVIDVVVRVRARVEAQVVGDVTDVTKVYAELDLVFVLRPCDHVENLITPFVGK